MAKKLKPMQYKDFTFPNNPSDCKYSCDRAFVSHKYPQLKGSELEDFGPNAVVISGNGEFFGAKAYSNWRKLLKEFKKIGAGDFYHPVYTDVNRALMTKCESSMEPIENYVAYSFEFIADNPPNIVKAKKTTKSSSDADDEKSSTSGGHKVGDIVYVTGYLYYDSYGNTPRSKYLNNQKTTITKIVTDPKKGQDYTFHFGTIGWGKVGQITKSAKSTNTTTNGNEVIATYVVKSGDNLSSICARYGANWKTVAKYNKLKNPNLIDPGDKIVIVR